MSQSQSNRYGSGLLSTGIPTISEPNSPIERPSRKRTRSDASFDNSPLSNVWKDTPLGDGQKIRILKLRGGTGPDLFANLSVHDPRDSYEALSYTWGTEREHSIIKILSGDEMYDVPITSNLANALHELRYKSEHRHRRLWIDALCINQKDHREKNHQVPKMASIYNEAKNVCVWLGPEKNERALKHIKRILDLKEFERLIEDKNSAEDWNSLLELMKRRWFSRRWVVQEIALAREATVHCGKDFVKWKDFAKAVALFGARRHQISRLFQGSATFDHQPNYLGDVTALAAFRLVQQSSNLFRKSDEGMIQEHLLSLETLVSILSPFEATKAHDIVYAVLSLAEDTGAKFSVRPAANPPPDAEETVDTIQELTPVERSRAQSSVDVWRRNVQEQFPVDYDKTFFQVCKDFLKFTIKHSESLDIICRPWAPTNSGEPLPSWIPTLSGSAFRPDANGVHSRVKADSLVGLPTLGRRNYNAARKFPLNLKKESCFRISEDGSLFVEGFVLDTVKEKSQPAMQGIVPLQWMELAGWEDCSVPPPDAFWRTLIADRDADGGNPPLYYEIACQQAFAQRAPEDDLNTHHWIQANRSIRASIEKVVVEYLQRLQSIIWGRRLAKTTTLGALGLVPDQAKKGDSVCILAGCSVPVLLREGTNPLTNKPCHELIEPTKELLVSTLTALLKYEISKRLGEHLVSWLPQRCLMRISGVYGPGFTRGFIARAVHPQPEGNVEAAEKRDFIYIDDLNDLLWKAAQTPMLGGHIFDGASGERKDLQEVWKMIRDLRGDHGVTIVFNEDVAQDDLVLDPAFARHLLGRDFLPIHLGLARTVFAQTSEIIRRRRVDQPHVIVLDVGATYLRVGVMNHHGHLLPETREAFTPSKQFYSRDTLAELQERLIKTIVREIELVRDRHRDLSLEEVGLAIDSVLTRDGIMHDASNLWSELARGYNFKEVLQGRLPGIRLTVLNDVSAAAWRYKDEKRFCLITVSSGLGSRTFNSDLGALDQLDLDAARLGGEMGHVVVEPRAVDALVQNTILRATACPEEFKSSRLYVHANGTVQKINVRSLGLAVKENDDFAVRLLDKAGVPSCFCGNLADLSSYSSGRGALSVAQMLARRGEYGVAPQDVTNQWLHDAIADGHPLARKVLYDATYPLALRILQLGADMGLDKFITRGGFPMKTAKGAYLPALQTHLVRFHHDSGFFSGWTEEQVRGLVRLGVDDDYDGLIGAGQFVQHLRAQKDIVERC